MSFLNRSHIVASSTVPVIKWDRETSAFVFQTPPRGGGAWINSPVTQPFALDIWRLQHGFDHWVHGVHLGTVLTSVSDPVPTSPEPKAKAIFSVPVYSAEFGGRRDLMITDKNTSDALDALLDEIAKKAKAVQVTGTFDVPVVEVTTTTTADFGTAPVFGVFDWTKRPPAWGQVIVVFP